MFFLAKIFLQLDPR